MNEALNKFIINFPSRHISDSDKSHNEIIYYFIVKQKLFKIFLFLFFKIIKLKLYSIIFAPIKVIEWKKYILHRLIFVGSTRHERIAKILFNHFSNSNDDFNTLLIKNPFRRDCNFLTYDVSIRHAFYSFIFLFKFKKLNEISLSALDHAFEFCLYFLSYNHLFKNSSIKSIYLFSDWRPEFEALLCISNIYDLDTIYIPHALSTSFPNKLFPKYALMHGLREYNYYSQKSLYKVVNFGDILRPKRKYLPNSNVNILVATSIPSDVKKIKAVLNFLLKKTNYNISLRLHPDANYSSYIDCFTDRVHDSTKDELENLLSNSLACISFNSNIALDAVYYGALSFEVEYEIDTYDFVKNNLSIPFNFNEKFVDQINDSIFGIQRNALILYLNPSDLSGMFARLNY